MTRRRKIALAVLLGLFLVVACFALFELNAVRRSRPVQLGMSIAEVRAIMGSNTVERQTTSKDDTITGSMLLAGHHDLGNKLRQIASDLGADALVDGAKTVMIVFNTDGRVVKIYRGDEPLVESP